MADCTFYGRKSKFRLHNLSEFIASLPFTVEQLPFEDIFRDFRLEDTRKCPVISPPHCTTHMPIILVGKV